MGYNARMISLLVASLLTGPVGTFTSKPFVFETNTHWIEGPDGVVLIDTQFLPEVGERAIAAAERATGKKVVLAIVLHANPDKFNGAHALRKREIRVITSEQVVALVPEVHALRKKWFFEKYAPDYPAEAPALEAFGNVSQPLEVAGLKLGLHVLGVGCSRAHVAVTYEDHVFVGDMVSNGHHAWTELGLIPEWLDTLARVGALGAAHVHVGRGPSGGPELLAAQSSYLRFVWQTVRAERPTGPSTPEVLARLRATIEAQYPGYGYGNFVKIGLPAVWERASGR